MLLWNPKRKYTKTSFREYRYKLKKHLHRAKDKTELAKSLAKIEVKPLQSVLEGRDNV